jgi:hypothetical protein
MRLLIAISLLVSFALLCLAPSGARAFAAPDSSAAKPALVVPVGTRVKRSVNHGRLCFWKENNGTQLGISGFCHWSDDARIGASCSCERTVEHKHEEHWGLVIEAPKGGAAGAVN